MRKGARNAKVLHFSGPKSRDITSLSCVKVIDKPPPNPPAVLPCPTKVEDVVGCVGNPEVVRSIEKWVASYVPGKRCLAICGPSGVGKTVLGRLMLSSFGGCTEIDVSTIVHDGAASKDMCHEIQKDTGYMADAPLLLDNVESPAWTETSLISALARQRTAPTIVVCDESRKARSRTCDVITLHRPTVRELARYLAPLVPDISATDLEGIVRRGTCDVRHIETGIADIRRNVPFWSSRDVFMDGDFATSRLFDSSRTSPVSALWQYIGIGDSNALVFENYHACYKPDTNCRINDERLQRLHMASCAMASDLMSMGDLIEHRLYRHQAWQLYDFRLFCGALAPAVCVGPIHGAVAPSTQRGKQSRKKCRGAQHPDPRLNEVLDAMSACR